MASDLRATLFYFGFSGLGRLREYFRWSTKLSAERRVATGFMIQLILELSRLYNALRTQYGREIGIILHWNSKRATLGCS